LFNHAHTVRSFGKNSLAEDVGSHLNQGRKDKSVRLYDATRHSFASNHLNNGTSLYKASKLMGHSSTKMTGKYAHVDAEGLRLDVRKALSLNRHQTVIKGAVNGVPSTHIFHLIFFLPHIISIPRCSLPS
jgi:hypothetical protein